MAPRWNLHSNPHLVSAESCIKFLLIENGIISTKQIFLIIFFVTNQWTKQPKCRSHFLSQVIPSHILSKTYISIINDKLDVQKVWGFFHATLKSNICYQFENENGSKKITRLFLHMDILWFPGCIMRSWAKLA